MLTYLPKSELPIELHMPVVLASRSPRRKELLKSLVPDFEVEPAGLDEESLVDPDPWVTAQRLAKEKCLAVFEKHPGALVIGGDTVVALKEGVGWVQLAQPDDETHAADMLRTLSGRTHTVVTGVCLRWPLGMNAFTESTEVTFRKLSDKQIERYIATGEPMDKAGSYGLQGLGAELIDKIAGSKTCVIGLPMEKLEEALRTI